MNVRKQIISCEEIRKTDMVEYLSRLGFEHQKISDADYWNLFPLIDEKTPSFKINRKKNCWFDFGFGKGGNIIDFAILYRDCTVGEFLGIFQNDFHQQPILKPIKEEEEQNRIKKDITTIKNSSKKVAVSEGFLISFISSVCFQKKK